MCLTVLAPIAAVAWSNGPAGNTQTDKVSECGSPPYSTHDWIPDHARALLPEAERAWLDPHRAVFLLGTEAPDNRRIPNACPAPDNGYDDRSRGHSVEWNAGFTDMVEVRAASRAAEEYAKAVAAFGEGKPELAAYYLGAMAHYIGDLSQYGHAIPDEVNHANYERWVGDRTDAFDAGTFEAALAVDSLSRRTPFTAGRRIALATARGKGAILPAETMDARFASKDQGSSRAWAPR